MKNFFDWFTDKIPTFENIKPTKPTDAEEANFKDASLLVAPVIWLLGKSGSGKSSIAAAITGASNVEIGSGFLSCTKTAVIYDFPEAQPLIRFLDTRGLGESRYDPEDDMRINEEQSHLIIAVVKADDVEQEKLITALTKIRKKHPDWPILVAQTCLHALYLNNKDNHPELYPYQGDDRDDKNTSIPQALRNSLKYQRELLKKIPGGKIKFVQIDFTRDEDDFTPRNFGLGALLDGILEVAPEAIKLLALESLATKQKDERDKFAVKANPTILYFAATAAGVGSIPIVGIATVASAQGAMLWKLASVYEVEWNWKAITSLTSMLGTSTVIRQAFMQVVRQFTKSLVWLIPIASAQDYAVTYALGKAACVYFDAVKDKREPDAEEIKETFSRALFNAFNVMSKAEQKC